MTLASRDIDATVRAFEARGVGVDRLPAPGRALRIVTGPDAVDDPHGRPQHAGTVFFEVVEETVTDNRPSAQQQRKCAIERAADGEAAGERCHEIGIAGERLDLLGVLRRGDRVSAVRTSGR